MAQVVLQVLVVLQLAWVIVHSEWVSKYLKSVHIIYTDISSTIMNAMKISKIVQSFPLYKLHFTINVIRGYEVNEYEKVLYHVGKFILSNPYTTYSYYH